MNNFFVDNFVQTNDLRPADTVVVNKPTRILDHYVIYLGQYSDGHKFIANYSQGVRILSDYEIVRFSTVMEPTRVRRFRGSDYERYQAVQRALNYCDSDSYHLILNNCEHYANCVQYGKRYSQQTQLFGAGLTIAGLATAASSRSSAGRNTGYFMAGLGLLTLMLESGNSNE